MGSDPEAVVGRILSNVAVLTWISSRYTVNTNNASGTRSRWEGGTQTRSDRGRYITRARAEAHVIILSMDPSTQCRKSIPDPFFFRVSVGQPPGISEARPRTVIHDTYMRQVHQGRSMKFIEERITCVAGVMGAYSLL